MRPSPSRAEWLLLLACAALLLLALLAPPMAQPGHLHDFADRRAWLGLPCALDVLSNLLFAGFGAWGLAALRRSPRLPMQGTERACAALFFAGLLVTAAGSAWYHYALDDIGLALDRAAMSMAFAGLLGLLAAGRVGHRAGRTLAVALLVLAPLAVFAWLRTGNIVPWAVVQFGGMALVLLLLATTRSLPGALPVRWGFVLAAYALAKVFELGDHAVFGATGELLSGHTLKHGIAAFAAWPVIAALAAHGRPQNPRVPVARAA
ncbi:MAG TPA: hypothetical protein VEB23_00160 [Ramlibacter sp.]|nr:hypothetical protein [Ramlibacter sp.]